MQVICTMEILTLNWLLLYARLNQVKQSIGSCEQKKSVKGPYLLYVACLHFFEK